MTQSKHMTERLQAIVADRQRVLRETQLLIDVTRRVSDADARLAQALDKIGAQGTKGFPARRMRASFA